MRRHITTAALALGVLVGSAVAWGDFSLQPAGFFRADDKSFKAGNTNADPDWEILHETADADQHNLTILNEDGTADVVIAWDDGIDWGVANSASLRVHSIDATAPTEYLGMSHDSTDARLTVGSGGLKILPASGQDLTIGNGALGGHDININVAANNTPRLIFLNAGNQRTIFQSNFSTDQTMISSQADGGRQLILTAATNNAVDHDHDAQTDPVLYIHSATNPNPTNTEYVSLMHDQTDGVVYSGKGQVKINTGIKMKYTAKANAASPYTVVDSDYFLGALTNTGAVEFDLPACTSAGRVLVVKDVGGTASTANITIDPNGTDQIDAGGAGTAFVINTNKGAVFLMCDGSNAWWVH